MPGNNAGITAEFDGLKTGEKVLGKFFFFSYNNGLSSDEYGVGVIDDNRSRI